VKVCGISRNFLIVRVSHHFLLLPVQTDLILIAGNYFELYTSES
jgi:hypothetical protein